MSIEEKIRSDRQDNAGSVVGQWLPEREDVEALGREYADEAFEQLGGADVDEVSWTFEPTEGDWDAFRDVVGGAADDEKVSEAFAESYHSRLESLVEEGRGDIGQDSIETTIGELADAWNVAPDEWGLLGAADWSRDETVWLVPVDGQPGHWKLERCDKEKGVRYTALDQRLSDEDVEGVRE